MCVIESGRNGVRKKSSKSAFTHVDANAAPTMVDVGAKRATKRHASAMARVRFPRVVAAVLREQKFNGPKGPIFHTAIIAGVQAAKRTHELIPFCHPIGIDGCKIDISMKGRTATILCVVSVEGKTGVEMEAIHGASVAAVTIYDMCKALSHDIAITHIKLIEKRGGKSDVGKFQEDIAS